MTTHRTTACPARGVYAGIFLLSAATLLFQVTLVRVFSVSIWYHFAFLVVSVALFGIGASGAVLSLVAVGPRDVQRRALAPAAFGISALSAYVAANAIPFAPFRILQEPRQILYFLLYDVLLMVPFFFSGAAVALILRAFPERAGRLYAFDLVGAAIGTLLVFAMLPVGGARGAIALAASLGVASSACLASSGRMRATSAATAIALLVLVVVPSLLPEVRIDGTKPVTKAIGAPGAIHAVSRWNALARIDVVEQPGSNPMIFIDAAAATPIAAPRESTSAARDLSAVGLRMKRGISVAVIGSGGGIDVQNALALGARSVMAVEINPIIIDLVTRRYRDAVGGVFSDPRVRLVADEGRSCIARSRERFDVVQITLIDTWAASVSGAYSLSENYLYTTEAFGEYLRHVEDDGYLSITRWHYEMPRLAALARAALGRAGVQEPWRHVLVAGQGVRGLILVKPTPFTPAEVAVARDYASRNGGELLHDPVGPPDHSLFSALLRAPDPDAFYRRYPFAIDPVNDDSPFFFQMARWRSMRLDALRTFGRGGILEPLAIPVAQIVLVSALGLGVLLSLALLAIPMARRAVPRARRGTWLAYFLALGFAYIVVEVVLMQRFALFLGHPTYSVSVVLFAILLFSGLGAAWSDRRSGTAGEVLRPALYGLPAAIVLLTFVAPPVLRSLMGLSLPARLAVAVATVGPTAFLMGMPFPTGIRAIGATDVRHVAWAWAANGCASVVGSVCAVLGAMAWSFSAMLVAAGVVYALALFFISRLRVSVT